MVTSVAAIPYDGRLLRCVRRAQEHVAQARILDRADAGRAVGNVTLPSLVVKR